MIRSINFLGAPLYFFADEQGQVINGGWTTCDGDGPEYARHALRVVQ